MSWLQLVVVAVAAFPVVWLFIAGAAAHGGESEPGLTGLLDATFLYAVVGVVAGWIALFTWLFRVAA